MRGDWPGELAEQDTSYRFRVQCVALRHAYRPEARFMKSVGFAFLVPLTIAACGGTPRASRRCEWPAESARPLDLRRAADRTHLRRDAESAETIAIHYSDVSPARREGPVQYAHARDACMASLFGVVARTHAVDVETVRAFSMHRNGWFDAIVLLSFAAVYGCAASALGGVVGRRFPRREWAAAGVSTGVGSPGAAGLRPLRGD